MVLEYLRELELMSVRDDGNIIRVHWSTRKEDFHDYLVPRTKIICGFQSFMAQDNFSCLNFDDYEEYLKELGVKALGRDFFDK